MNNFGRQIIMTSESEINDQNVLIVLNKAMSVHASNRADIDYLYNYYKGNQPILDRVKEVRPEINNKIVENRANEIVSFKTGYLCGEPIQYVSRTDDEKISDAINQLNELMFAEDKQTKDQEIVEWQMICGTSYRMVLPDPVGEEDEAPFEIYTLDPRFAFVVYSDDIGNKPMMGVKYRVTDTGKMIFSIYTDTTYYEINTPIVSTNSVDENSSITKAPHALGMIPIFEYPANNARMGSFEIVLPLLDALNNINSNRMDGIEQQIQSLMVFFNCEVDADKFQKMKDMGAVTLKSIDGLNSDVKAIVNELNQSQTQTLKDDINDAIITICGMPNRNGGSSTSDTGAAVVLRDGWSEAEARAKDSETIFKKSEKGMLKLVLRLCSELTNLNLKLKDVELKFTRRNYDNIQSKSQVLTTMLNNSKIHPLLAFTSCGMFTDAQSAYLMSMKYYDEQQAKLLEQQQAIEVNTKENSENTEE